jgi:hypothetical protein
MPVSLPTEIPGPAQFDFYERWLSQWSSTRVAPGAEINARDPLDCFADRSKNAGLRADDSLTDEFDSAPAAVGEVRLLAGWLTPSVLEPVYVLVLRELSEGWKLIVPFSKFTVPATPEELLLYRSESGDPRAGGPTSVSCAWNAAAVPDSALKQSWLAGLCEEEVLVDVAELFDAIQQSKLLPPRLADRVGSALSLLSGDPRHEYLAGEVSVLSELVREAFRVAGGVGSPISPLLLVRIPREVIRGLNVDDAPASQVRLAAAAGEAAVSDWSARFTVHRGGSSLEILCVIRPDGGTALMHIYVLDSDGEPFVALDGTHMIGDHGGAVAVVKDAHASVPAEAVQNGFGLRLPDGTSLSILPK